jgi:hypothetical protein
MKHTLSIESSYFASGLANPLLAKFLPQAIIYSNPWLLDPTFIESDGWYTNNNTQFTTLHNQLTSLILNHFGDTNNVSETYVYITYYL